MTDERQGLTSASAFEVDALCPGRKQLLDSLPEEQRVSTSDEYAERGTRIHRARELMNGSELDEEDREIYERGLRTEQSIVEQWCRDFEITEYGEGPREMRMWIHDPDTAQRAASAKLDVHYVARTPIVRVLVIDWKALYAVRVTPAERNYQARVQTVCVAHEYDAEHVRMAFNKAMFGKQDVVDYARQNIPRAEESIFRALWEMGQPGAPRRAGDHCYYCPCKVQCPEAKAHAMLPSVLAQSAVGLDKAGAEALVSQMALTDCAFIHTRWGETNKIFEAIKARLKTLTNEQLTELGLVRDPKGRRMPSINKGKECFRYLFEDYNIKREEIWSAMKFSTSELVEALRRDQGWGKAQAEGFVKQLVDKFGEVEYSEPSIKAL